MAGTVMELDFERIWPSIPYILEGVQITVGFTAVCLFLGFIWGTILALAKVGEFRVFKWFSEIYTSVFRGTPLLLQLTLIYFATPQLTGYQISIWEAGILTFTLNSGAYVSEIIRGGINAVDKGQKEAALSLGLPYRLIMKDIILPQAVRNILPSLVNESIDLLKESSLISVIGGADILRRANIVASDTYLYFEPLLVAGLLYYVLVMILTTAARYLERKLRVA
jgi:His/Glu/Gln/Arg/opine family amino acid ABC transporter permease subunit